MSKIITMAAIKPSSLCRQTSFLINAKRTSFERRRAQAHGVRDKDDPKFFVDTTPNPLADIEERIEESKKKLVWRQPMHHQVGPIAELAARVLAPEHIRTWGISLHRMFGEGTLLEKLQAMEYEQMCYRQRFLPDRHRILGNDLAAAHFLVARGGQVKFTKSAAWVKKDDADEYQLPNKYDPSFLLQAIKCDGMTLVYEGLENLRRLNHLQYLSFHNVEHFDDWCADRICGQQFERLEVLDLSGTKVTGNGLIAVPKLPALKAIVLDTVDRSLEFQLSCSLLEEAMPGLRIINAAEVHDETKSKTKKLEA